MDLSKMKRWSADKGSEETASERHIESIDSAPLPVGEAPVEAPIDHVLPPPVRNASAPGRNEVMHRPSSGASASMMISLVLGAIFIFLGVRFAQWAVATLSGRAFDTRTTWLSGERAGQTVAYWELVGRVAWTEMGTFAMGVALLLDSVVICLATRGGAVRRPLVAAAMAITAVAVLANLGLSATLFSDGVTPLFSIIAVLVGAFMLFDHWALLTGRSD